MDFVLLLVPPLLAAVLAMIVRPYRAFVGWSNALLSLIPLGAALQFAGLAIAGGEAPTFGPGEMFRADSLSALLMVCITAAAFIALYFSPGLRGETAYNARQLRRYHVFMNLFIAAMLVAVSANNVGILWIAVEATTIFSAFVIPLALTKDAVEASWKYILICSVGIALAFAGTVLGYFDFVTLSGRAGFAELSRVENALNWPVLLETAPRLHPEVMQLAFVFLLIGYGTKAGIAPMHTWLPDAHSEAPAPLSAMMSGVLLAVATYAIVRWKVVVDATLGSNYTNNLLLALGLLSLLIASFSLVQSHNYKRMLAYSSIEHTGLICLGLGMGPLGAFAAMLHLLNHAVAKPMLFILAGRVLHRYHTTEIGRISGLLKAMPWTGGMFAAAILAIIGLPPFGLFISEFALFRAGFATGHPWLMGAVLALLAVAFVALISHLNKMLYGAPAEGVAVGEASGWQIAPLFLSVAVLVTLGLTQPAPLTTLLNQIVAIVARP